MPPLLSRPTISSGPTLRLPSFWLFYRLDSHFDLCFRTKTRILISMTSSKQPSKIPLNVSEREVGFLPLSLSLSLSLH